MEKSTFCMCKNRCRICDYENLSIQHVQYNTEVFKVLKNEKFQQKIFDIFLMITGVQNPSGKRVREMCAPLYPTFI